MNEHAATGSWTTAELTMQARSLLHFLYMALELRVQNGTGFPHSIYISCFAVALLQCRQFPKTTTVPHVPEREPAEAIINTCRIVSSKQIACHSANFLRCFSASSKTLQCLQGHWQCHAACHKNGCMCGAEHVQMRDRSAFSPVCDRYLRPADLLQFSCLSHSHHCLAKWHKNTTMKELITRALCSL